MSGARQTDRHKSNGVAKVERFDIDAVPVDLRGTVGAHIQAVHGLIRRTAEGVVEIGQHLIALKSYLEHGLFMRCIDVEFGVSHDSATRFIRAAEVFGQNPQIAEFAPSALYALSERSTPETAREEAIERASQGERISNKTATEIIARHKEDHDEDANGHKPSTGKRPSPLTYLANIPRQVRAEYVQKWPDMLHTFALVADARGWTTDAIAGYLGANLAEVEAFLCPTPPVRFDDRWDNDGSDFLDAAEGSVLAQAYANTVRRDIEGSLAICCQRAAWQAKAEGWPDTAAALEARSKQHERMRDRLLERTLFALDILGDEETHVALCCALADARAAMGIEAEVPTLGDLYRRFYPVVAKQRAAG